MEEEVENLTEQVAEQAEQRSRSRLLMTHPGVGQFRRWPVIRVVHRAKEAKEFCWLTFAIAVD
jgi:hypothetical protein